MRGTLLLRLSMLRVIVVSLSDAAIAGASLWVAFRLRFAGGIEPAYLAVLPVLAGLLVLSRLAANASFHLQRWSFRFSGLEDAARIGAADVLGTGMFVLLIYLFRALSPPRSVVAIELLLSGVAMTSIRFAPRLGLSYYTHLARVGRGAARRTLIVGAGAAGQMLLANLRRSGAHSYHVIGFVEDARRRAGLVGGRPVLGDLSALKDVVTEQRISDILIAIEDDSQGIVRDVLTRCAGLDVRIRALPASFALFEGRGVVNLLRDLSPENLLARGRVSFDPGDRGRSAGRRVLVTGAAGSIGSEICRQLLDLGAGELLALDINENGLYLLDQRFRREFPGRPFTTELADIRDRGRVEALLRAFKPQDVFHAAAHKHVPIMEAAPCEAVKNNVIGTSYVLLAAERHGVECTVFISTDKAVSPTSVMGATKRVGELMTRAVADRSAMRGCVVRFGNVLGSAGSIVPLFQQQIEAGGPVTITDPEAHRYFMTIPEAVGLVLKAAYSGTGDLCVLDMGDPIRIMDLARQMIAMAGHVPEKDIKIVVTGLRPGEKLREDLLTEEEEVTVRSDGRIQVVSAPRPRPDLWRVIDDIGEAAAVEDAVRVLDLLQTLVPSYRRSKGASAARAAS